MKQNDVTQVNIMDFIVERKRGGSKYIRWNSRNSKFFKRLFVVTSDIYTKPLERGVVFAGIKHYWE